MIRTLVVDDSHTTRILLSELINRDPAMEVVAEAESGERAIELAQRLRPDLITMDIHMAGMNGFETSQQIMIRCPTPIVIVTASTSFKEVDIAMDALRVGALSALRKPALGTPEFEIEARAMIGTLKAMAGVKVVTRRAESRRSGLEPRRADWSPSPPNLGETPGIVAIGASTGGPSAVANLLSSLPADFAVPILLVQHICPGFTGGYAHWLDAKLPLNVKVAVQGERLCGGTVYVAQDDYHLGVSSTGRIAISDSPPVNGFRPSCSVLFSSAAAAFGSATVGVILTGMGDDGVSGLKDVQAAGGKIFAQDEASSVVFGMPKAAIDQGLAKHGTPVELIAASLNRCVRSSH